MKTSTTTRRTEILSLVADIGASPDTITALSVATTRDQVQDAIAADARLSDAKQDLDTAWAVDLPSAHHKARWERYTTVFSGLSELPGLPIESDHADPLPGYFYVGRKATWYHPDGYAAATQLLSEGPVEGYRLGRVWDVYRSESPIAPGGARHFHYTLTVDPETGLYDGTGSMDTRSGRYRVVIGRDPNGTWTVTLFDGHEIVRTERHTDGRNARRRYLEWAGSN